MNTEQLALLRKTLEYVTDHPKEWNQSGWGCSTSCGTVACIAGTALILSDEVEWKQIGDNYVIENPNRASEILGLDHRQSNELFFAPTNTAEVWKIANEITKGAIEIPLEFL